MKGDEIQARQRGRRASGAARRRSRPALEVLETRRLLASPPITVNTLADTFDGSITDGTISLRDALAGSLPGGIINFSVTGTIHLALGPLVVQDRIIDGPGASKLTIDAHDQSAVFNTLGTTTLSGLTITGGSGAFGGAIRSDFENGQSNLTVVDSVVTGNVSDRGGGIDVEGGVGEYGHLTVLNSTISNNKALNPGVPLSFHYGLGGGIYGKYTYVTVDKSTISDNSATDFGGGIYGGRVQMTNSTVSGNSASLGTEGYGGGVYVFVGTIANSTISGNSGDGIRGDFVAIANSTITNNGYGINSFDGQVTVVNSIVVGNGGDDIAGSVDAAASRNNLIGNPRNAANSPQRTLGPPAGGLIDGVNGNIVNVLDPGVGPLADNGGPTQTCALYSYSPAVNAGDNALVPIDPSTGLPYATDQTGAPRIFDGGTVDMGAVEVQGTVVPSTVVNTAIDDVAANGLTSLREAIGFASRSGSTVTFDPTVFGTPQTIALVHGPITVNGTSVPVTITGPGAALTTLDAGVAPSVFVTHGTTTISGLTITGDAGMYDLQLVSWADGSKVPIFGQNLAIAGTDNSGLLHIRIFDDLGNLTDTYEATEGGTLHLLMADASGAVQRDTPESNLLPAQSQAIAALKQQLPGLLPPHVLSDAERDQVFSEATLITGQTFKHYIGAIANVIGTLTVQDCRIVDNETRGIINGQTGAALGKCTLAVVNSTISGNQADRGGGIYSYVSGLYSDQDFKATAPVATITSSIIDDNTAITGGGVFCNGTTTISNSTISNNSAVGRGGGIAATRNYSEGATTVVNSIISGNSARGAGGGLFRDDADKGALTILGSAISGNGVVGSYGLQVMSWGDGSGVPTPAQHPLIIAGTDNSGLLHIRTLGDNGNFDAYEATEAGTLHLVFATLSGVVTLDAPEASLPAGQVGAISDLKQHLPGWVPPHVLSALERAQGLRDAVSITGDLDMGGDGGGIQGHGVMVVNSTISGNAAQRNGGGIDSAAPTVINSTISGNVAESTGGGMRDDAAATIENSTIANNTAYAAGGGLFDYGSTVYNSIIAGNRAGVQTNDVSSAKPLNAASVHNLIGDAASAGGVVNGVNGNIVGVDPTIVFGPLADNGGPTQTMALLPNSPALNAGDPAFDPNAFSPPLLNDQRGSGFARVRGGTVDIGAYEVQDDLPTITSQLTAVTVNEGSLARNTGSFDDPQGRDTVVGLTASLGSVTENGGTWSWSYQPPDDLAGPISVSITATDNLGMKATTTFTLTVNNLAPIITAFNVPGTDTEGSPVTLSAAATDPAGALDPLVFHWTINEPNGSIFQSVGPTPTLDFTPADNGGYLVTLEVSDDEGASVLRMTTLNVSNVAPTATITGAPASGHSPEGTTINLGSTVTDPSTVDTAAGFTYAGSVTENGSPFATGSAASFSFTPSAAGTYLVTLIATDNDGGASQPASGTIIVDSTATAASVSAFAVDWGTAGAAALLTASDDLRLLPSGRVTDLPWTNISKFAITLSQPATLSPGDVSVTGVNVANYGPVSISGSGTNYTITLAQAITGADRVTVAIGNAGITTYTRRLDVLPGDVNDDGLVNKQDIALERDSMVGFRPTLAAIIADINGDGVIDINDYKLVRSNVGKKLP